MATLLPSLSSDEDLPKTDSKNPEESSDDDDSGDEIDGEFQFGSILGEDGGSSFMDSKKGWSYQSALKALEKDNKGTTTPSDMVSRMEVSSLIAAKRKNLKQKKNNNNKTRQVSEEEEEEEESNNDDDSGSDNDSDSDSSEEGDDQVDDADREMEKDVLKTRVGNDETDDKSTRKKVKKEGNNKDKEEDNSEEDEDSDEEEESSDDDDSNDSDDDVEEAAKAMAFFETPSGIVANNHKIQLFAELNLSRPLLRGVAAMGFVNPTPIQSSVIPMALAGRDICASAVTGSGKTAAFVLPILERLFHRGTVGRTKALILAPTRELAAQCLGMMTTMAQHTKLRCSLIVGGTKNVNTQAAELRARPDIVVATPGRLLDHVTNSAGVSLDDIEFLILDEADRLLDMGFSDEVQELIKACPVQRQTMLFSATMNTKVDELIKLSLKRPIRVRVSDKNSSGSSSNSDATHNKDIEVAPKLEQEFVRIRSGNEGINREAMLLALLTRTFSNHVIVFFDTKAIAHRLMILCGLCGIKCTELHGNLNQTQRLNALEQFRKREVDVLLATDLAARGLDIDRVETVINFEMPNQVETYVHRIGRTARAGRGGRSCTLIGENRRHLMKEVIKDANKLRANNKNNKNNNKATGGGRFETGVIRSRVIPPAVIAHFVEKIETLEPHLKEVLQAEAVAKLDRVAEMEAIKAQNVIEHSDEIMSRPKKEWFATIQQKEHAKEAYAEKQRKIAEKVGTGCHRMTRKKRRAREAKEALLAATAAENDDNDNGKSSKNKGDGLDHTEVMIKASARAAKRKHEEKTHENAQMSIDQYEHKMREKKKRKGVRASDAAGDSSLFNEERVAFAPKSKKAETPEPSRYHFRGYDPDKKLGKKKGNKAFKSKKKYKRR